MKIILARQDIGIVSRFVLNAIPNELPRCNITPNIRIKIGIVSRDFADLSPAAKSRHCPFWKNFVLYRHTVFNESIDPRTQQPIGYFNDFF